MKSKKTIKPSELQELTIQDINVKLRQARETLSQIRLDVISGKEKNVSRIKAHRLVVARLMTTKTQKEKANNA